MIVPRFWAEGRAFHRSANRQVTVRRFGWSNDSQSAAQTMADGRAQEALEQILSGKRLPRREPKVGYNGAERIPIREEIVATYGSSVITRNSYGARCLNSPEVFFADIDYRTDLPASVILLVLLALAFSGIYVGWITGQKLLATILAIGLMLFAAPVARLFVWVSRKLRGGPDVVARNRVSKFIDTHREWNVRLYRTPAGLRILATHQTFDPQDPSVSRSFRELGADPLYVRMCLKQNCFRARVSAKPWRVGISDHMKPRPGIWPISAERMPDRIAWITRYEMAANGYAACEFLESLGSGVVSSQVKDAIELHDRLSQANSRLPIA